VAGAGDGRAAGFVLDLDPPPPPPAPRLVVTPYTRRDRFWQVASPTARRLAGLLAAAPMLNLPIVRLVRQAMLPEALQVHEAEVLLGGLLRIVSRPGSTSDDALHPDEVRYDFHEGLRSLLLDAVPTADAAEVLDGVSAYVEEHLGQGRGFRAVLADPAAAAARGSLPPDQSPFARVAAEVLLRLGGDHARLVTRPPTPTSRRPAAPGAAIAGKIGPHTGASHAAEAEGEAPRWRATGSTSIQEKLFRVRRPRVQITYTVETEGAKVEKELPFVVGVVGDFSGKSPNQPLQNPRDRKFIPIDRDNFNDVLARMQPRLAFQVPNRLANDGSGLHVELRFQSLADFGPDALVGQFDPMVSLLGMRRRLVTLSSMLDANPELGAILASILVDAELISALSEQLERGPTAGAEESDEPAAGDGGLLGQVLDAARPRSAADAAVLKMTLKDLVAAPGEFRDDRELGTQLLERVIRIDRILSAQVCEILRHPSFQKLEAAWRGLHRLVHETETGPSLKIRVLDISKSALFRDLDSAVEFDQSRIFKKLYEDEYSRHDGEPYGALIGDYEFSSDPDDMALLSTMSNVAAAAFCPFIAAASPKLFGFEEWTELSKPRDLEKIFQDGTYFRWKTFRESEDSRFVTLVMPRVLARLPYGASTKPIAEFGFEEVDASKPVPHDHFTWMNAAYVLGTKMTAAFATSGFCVAIRGAEGGGKVEGLPAFIFKSDDGDSDLKCPTEIGITDRRENELGRLGFLPLCHHKNTDYAVFLGAQTTQKPKKYDRPEATANAAISARLPYIMATSRFAHYLKVMARDMIGSFKEASNVEVDLNRWINNYVNANEKAGQELKAKFPLREAKVVVEEIPGHPGSYNAKVWMRPWLQFEELTAALMMVAVIPKKF